MARVSVVALLPGANCAWCDAEAAHLVEVTPVCTGHLMSQVWRDARP